MSSLSQLGCPFIKASPQTFALLDQHGQGFLALTNGRIGRELVKIGYMSRYPIMIEF